MSDLESKIKQLEREVALKKAYQSVQINFPKTAKLPEDVTQEVTQRLCDIAQKLAMGESSLSSTPETFSSEEVQTLKLVAAAAMKRSTLPKSEAPTPQASQPTPIPEAPKPQRAPEPKKAKIQITENIRGEARKYAVIDDEVYVPDPDKTDVHGMVSAVHSRRGGMMKIPLDDLTFIS